VSNQKQFVILELLLNLKDILIDCPKAVQFNFNELKDQDAFDCITNGF